MLFLGLCFLAFPASAGDYIGARQCGSCHPAEYAQWKQTPHARAADGLTVAERRDPSCSRCHSTAVEDGHQGVQCESCHGPGRHYWPEAVMKDLRLARAVGLRSGENQQMCIRCHTAKTTKIRPFDYQKMLQSVIHAPSEPERK